MSEKDAKFYYNKGIIYNEEGKYGLAVDNFKTALSLESDSFEINFNLGVAYINKKEYVLAIECFKFVLAKSPDEVAALSNIALAYAKNNELSLAIENYKKVLVLKPDDTPTYKDLGDSYTKNRQYDDAIESYKVFLKAHPTSFVVKESLNTAINLKKNQDGSTLNPVSTPKPQTSNVENIETVKKSSAEEYFNIAISYIKEQQFDLAIENLRNCLKINSEYPQAYDMLNKLFKIKEKADLNKKTETPKSQPMNQTTVSQVSSLKQDIKKSYEYVDYRKFTENFTMGVAYYGVKNYSSALDHFKNAHAINPNDEACKKYISDISSILNS